MLYPILYGATAISLGLWYFYQRNEERARIFQNLFFGLFAAYAVTVFVAEVPTGQKLAVLFRDLCVLSAAGLAFLWAGYNKRKFYIAATVVGLGLSWFYVAFLPNSLTASPNVAQSYDPSAELLLELAEGEEPSVLQPIAYKYDLDIQTSFSPGSPEQTELDDYYIVDIPEQQLDQVGAIIADLQSIPQVDWVEPNEQVNIDPVTADKLPKVNRKFGINDPGLEQLWGFEAMKVDALYQFISSTGVKPTRKALIAILDTGVDGQHEDLKAHYRSLNPSDDNDPKGHGTHCAGIAGAVSNNGLGIASFSLGDEFVEITSIKVLNASGMGSQRSIINGMIKAADAGAAVISLSLGGMSNQSRERAYKKAVDYARKKGCIVVAAAGNSNRNAKNFVPAGVEGVISVSALDQELQRAVFSNYITDLQMGIAAPGVGIYSTVPGSEYATYSGTSMACPYVAGLVGLLKSINPELTTEEAYDILHRTGKNTKNTSETGRLIQPHAALAALVSSS
jgi:thermitase